MAHIKLQTVSVEFPIFNSSSRSLTNSIVSAATGGKISANESGHLSVAGLSDISLEINSGDRIGIVGHNGSGKSTLLRVLAGIYEPTSGSISRSGRISSLIDIGIGISPENTGKENIYLRGRMIGLSNNEVAKKLDEIVEFAELGDFIHLPVRTYSSGMLLRLAFAVSTSIDTDILIMDEWLSVGDGGFASKAEQRLADLVDNSEILIIASHSKALLEKVSTSTMWLEQGKLKGISETAGLLEDYFS